LNSTDEVYGSHVEGSFSEADVLNPSSPYSASKAAADLLVSAYHRTYDMEVVTIMEQAQAPDFWSRRESSTEPSVHKAIFAVESEEKKADIEDAIAQLDTSLKSRVEIRIIKL
jgi:hypothetical protein